MAVPKAADGKALERGGQSPAVRRQPYAGGSGDARGIQRVRCWSLEAIGYADVAAKKPMRTDRLFWIASMSKPMTATALMMLVDEGKLKVDDPVEKYLLEFRRPDGGGRAGTRTTCC